MKLNSRDLSSFNRCTIRRNHNEITTKSAKGNAYNKAVLVKSIIKESLIKTSDFLKQSPAKTRAFFTRIVIKHAPSRSLLYKIMYI